MAQSLVSVVPVLAIDEIHVRGLKKVSVATLMTDLISLFTTLDQHMSDLMCFTNPNKVRHLWQEAQGVIHNTRSLVLRVEEALTPLHWTGGVKKPAPASRFLDSTKVTFESLERTLEFYSNEWAKKQGLLLRVGGGIFTSDVFGRWSRRPLPEILVEAILLTQQPQGNISKQAIAQWFVDLQTLRTRSPLSNPQQANQVRLTNAQIQRAQNMNPDDKSVRVGNVACVSTAWTNNALFTGSTLIKWGTELGKLRVGQGVTTLSVWFRSQRQERFSTDEQAALNGVVERFIEEYTKRMKGTLNRTEAQHLEEQRALDHQEREFSENKEVVARFLKAKTKALKHLGETYSVTWPPVMQKFHQAELYGQAYSGQDYALKRKCPVCAAVYPFQVAENILKVRRTPQNWKDVGEADPNKINGPRGCCAEALVFIGTVRALRLFDELCATYKTR